MQAEQTVEVVKEKKRPTVFGVEFVYLCVLGIGTAFIGWVAENAVRSVTVGVWDCRFHFLPFISPYALIIFAVHIAFGNPDRLSPFGRPLFKKDVLSTRIASNVIVLAVMYLSVFLGELSVGNLWDILFGVKLWNYSDLPFQVTQYAGLLPTLGYGTCAYLLFRFVYTPALKFVRSKMKYGAALTVTCTLGVLMVLDTVFMIVYTIVARQPPMYWSVKF
ncbi:MAG: hypothetical protein ACI4MH_00815 [Candidatus Coproplasma sp.]